MEEGKAINSHVGGVTDQSSRIGRQHKIAMEMALHSFPFSTSFPKLKLLHNDSDGNSARAMTSGKFLDFQLTFFSLDKTLPKKLQPSQPKKAFLYIITLHLKE